MVFRRFLLLLPYLWMLNAAAAQSGEVIVVVGAVGTTEYAELFTNWASNWKRAATTSKMRLTEIGTAAASDVSDRDQLRARLVDAKTGATPLWLILIGHGTFDRREAKFNLRGPDVSASELKDLIAPLARPVAVIDLTAASAPFLQQLTGHNRVVITATKSGGEQNFPQFGGYLSAAIHSAAADLDKDEQISLWEAFLFASRRTAEFYAASGRLQTEHALLDDNGDGQGTRAEAFAGLIATQSSAATGVQLDGDAAHQWHLLPSAIESALTSEQRQTRQSLEQALTSLKARKSTLTETEYFESLESLLVQLAELQSSHLSSMK